ncbi:MAG: YegP family protein [Anaerolineaceae bacterium]|nr:YegP family protein [Anaerolineaceae bacterium]MBN2677488.1 YegP family protein [Anaerolineaceae bacterium]
MAAKFELKQGKNGKFSFNLKAGNGRVILTSESYDSESGALNGIASVKKNAGKDGNFERKTSVKNEPFFVLKASNGEPIGRSEMYSSTSAMENGIASVKANAGIAAISNLTTTRK